MALLKRQEEMDGPSVGCLCEQLSFPLIEEIKRDHRELTVETKCAAPG